MHISGMSGNEIYCLSLKGLSPGEITVGNSVYSMGVAGQLGSFGRSLSGGEITQVTSLISDGRHAAIGRMEEESRQTGAVGITGVETKLGTLAGYTEFLAQGTAVHGQSPWGTYFSSAASGIELYCHLDAGYRPLKFAMGNMAYALGVGRGLTGSLRTLARGEVKEFSSMYNDIRHEVLRRLRSEACQAGANAVVDISVQMLPYGPGTVELLLTGTASHHPALSPGAVQEPDVVTSELSGEELWNLAQLGLRPSQLVMATSVYSLGVTAGIGAMFQALGRGELTDVTRIIYEARENCLDLVRQEAEGLGAERVIGNRLQIKELGSGMVEIVAIGTAVKRAPEGMQPQTPALIPQAVIIDKGSKVIEASIRGMDTGPGPMDRVQHGARQAGSSALGSILALLIVFVMMACGMGVAILSALSK